MSDSDCTFGLWYDLRNPPGSHRPFSTLYREVLDQIAWAETLGIGSVWLTEHHFVEDGYTPSPFPIAAAIGERTRTMRIGTNLIVAPLHNPVRDTLRFIYFADEKDPAIVEDERVIAAYLGGAS